MKLLVAVLLVSVFACERPIVYTQADIDRARNDGRFNEKMRWADYQLKVKDEKALELQMMVLCGRISIEEGFRRMTDCAMDIAPFYTTCEYK